MGTHKDSATEIAIQLAGAIEKPGLCGGAKSLEERPVGKRIKNKKGYITTAIAKDSPYDLMATSYGWVLEHRLIMAIELDRCLESSEIVHHKNGVKDDNRVENLVIKSNGQHSTDHGKGYQDGFKKGYRDGLKEARKGVSFENS